MNKEIYCYNIDDIDQHILNTIAQNLGIQVFLLDDGMMNKTVAQILEHQHSSNQDCTRYETAFMLMNNIEEEDFRSIVEQTKAAKWGVDPVKMMVTEHNREWTLASLFEEVSKEHALFQKVEQIASMMRQVNDLDMSQWDEEKKENMKMTVMKAYMLLNGGDFDEKRVDESLNELNALMGE